MISIVIPFKNEFELIDTVINHIVVTAKSDDYEIIVVNDGSFSGDGKFRPYVFNGGISVINSVRSFGVGYSFDRGTERATGDIVVLMGADVFPLPGWYDKVKVAVENNSRTLGCAVCVGLNPARMSLDDPKNFKRYGADLLFKVTEDDLPQGSVLRNKKGGYTALFKGKWTKGVVPIAPQEISCLMGAFYFTSRDYYNRIGGWDTEVGNIHCGHRYWGHLEPHISLKSWLVGGGCTLYPSIQAGHVFARRKKGERWQRGLRSAEWLFWNQLWILETCILDDSLRKSLAGFLHPELNLNVSRKMIKNNYDTVLRYREANRLKFQYDHRIFKERFGYKF